MPKDRLLDFYKKYPEFVSRMVYDNYPFSDEQIARIKTRPNAYDLVDNETITWTEDIILKYFDANNWKTGLKNIKINGIGQVFHLIEI